MNFTRKASPTAHLKRRLCLVLCALLCFSAAACAAPFQEETTTVPEENRVYTGTSAGYGGDVTVTLETDVNGILTSLTVTGENETAAIGGAALETYNAEILPAFVGLEISSIDFSSLDAVSSATLTSNAVRRAAQAAQNAALGIEEAVLSVPDGIYTGSAAGFALGTPITVTLTVTNGWISGIEYGENDETAAMWTLAQETAERVIEARSLAVDAVAGATVSGNGVKAAIEDALVNGAGVDASTLYQSVTKSTAEIVLGSPEEPYNVLVIGFGGSGMAAALSAVQHTDNIIAIELNGKLGGNTSTASGPMGINPASKVALNGGLPFVDTSALLSDWLAYTTDSSGEQDANPTIVENFIENSGETNDWLERNGFSLSSPTSFLTEFICSQSFTDYSLDHVAVTEDFEFAADKFRALGGELLLETKGTGYLLDDTGAVIGAVAEGSDGTAYTIYAKTVIQATGGFGGSDAMMEEYLGGAYKVYGMQNCDGTMIQAAIDIGADTQNIGMPPMSHFSAPYTILTSFEDVAYTSEGLEGTYSPNDILDAILLSGMGMDVNAEGERFYNETAVDMESWIAGPYFWTIIDQATVDSLRKNGLMQDFSTILGFRNQGNILAGEPLTMINDVLEAGIEVGEVYRADTIEELAELIGADPGVLSTQLTTYNQYCAEGTDPDFGKDATWLTALETGPYYAVKGAAYIYSTVGGLKVDEQMRVLSTDGKPINGLYAVGTDSMGVLMAEDKFYLGYGGVAMGWVFYSGRTAGIAAAAAAEGWRETDVTEKTAAAIQAAGGLSSLPYVNQINSDLTIVQLGDYNYELTGIATCNSALNTLCGFAEDTSVVALYLPQNVQEAAVSSVLTNRYDGSSTEAGICFSTSDGLLYLQPIDEELLASGGAKVELSFEDGSTLAFTLFTGTLYTAAQDDCLTEEALALNPGQEAKIYRTGSFSYQVQNADVGMYLYLPTPARVTDFVSAAIRAISYDGSTHTLDETIDQPGDGISFVLESSASIVTVTVDWNFTVPTTDIWTGTVTEVPYTNTVTYEFALQ